MLDHMTFRVTDIARTKAFYTAALAPLGYSLCFEGNYGSNMLGYAYPAPSEPDGKKADVWFIDGPSPYGGPPATTPQLGRGRRIGTLALILLLSSSPLGNSR